MESHILQPPFTCCFLISNSTWKLWIERAPNIFTKNDVAFQTLYHTMDSVYRKLRADSVGTEKQSTDTFTKEEENKLWECGVLGVDNPTSLLRAVFFSNGKKIYLRSGNEHRNLWLSQLKRTENGYMYTKNASKNHSGGLAQLHVKNKSMKILKVEIAVTAVSWIFTSVNFHQKLLKRIYFMFPRWKRWIDKPLHMNG